MRWTRLKQLTYGIVNENRHPMKISSLFFFILFLILVILHYQLWFSSQGFTYHEQLKKQIEEIQAHNHQLQVRNATLISDINFLKHSQEAIEEAARNDLGFVKSEEVFYQIIS